MIPLKYIINDMAIILSREEIEDSLLLVSAFPFGNTDVYINQKGGGLTCRCMIFVNWEKSTSEEFAA
jgi:hypothetical protein